MSQPESQNCPVCGLGFKSLQQLEQHVEEHFTEDPGGAGGPALSTAAGAGTSGPLNSVLCPLGCGQWVPLQELDEHEKAHEVAMSENLVTSLAAQDQHQPTPAADEERAQLLALQAAEWGDEPAAAGRANGSYWDEEAEWGEGDEDAYTARQLQEQQDFAALQAQYGFSTKRDGKCHICKQEGHWARDCPQNPHAACKRPRLPLEPSLLAAQQAVEPQWQDGGADVIPLLAERLAQQRVHGLNEVWLCGPVKHFSSNASDRGWGCGWRNIQMQVSHLRMRPDGVHKATLFGASHMVPDIGALQAWLEVAWAAGFDVAGAESLGNSVQCGTKWVGTTEACTLLRYQHVSAHIIDFTGPSGSRTSTTASGATIHTGVTCDRCEQCPIIGVRLRSLTRPDFDLCELCGRLPDLQAAGPFQRLGQSGAQQQQHAGSANAVAAPQFSQLRGGTRQGEQACKLQGGAASRQGGENAAAQDALWWEAMQQGRQGRQPPGGRARGRGKRGRAQEQIDMDSQEPVKPAGGPTYSPMQVALLEWVWNYFTGQHEPTAGMYGVQDEQHGPLQEQLSNASASAPTSVSLTGMPPLYLQHAGHSRSIIGIERRPRPGAASVSLDGMYGRTSKRGPGQLGSSAWQQAEGSHAAGQINAGTDVDSWVYCLLILDPSCPAHEFAAALRRGSGWQKYVKRGLHLLRHDEYQLLYCLNHVATAAELEAGKIVRPAEVLRAAQSA